MQVIGPIKRHQAELYNSPFNTEEGAVGKVQIRLYKQVDIPSYQGIAHPKGSFCHTADYLMFWTPFFFVLLADMANHVKKDK